MFLGFIGYLFWTFVFVAYLMVIFWIIADLFRDETVNGWGKAIWIIFLVFVPFLTALVYFIARGSGMEARRAGDRATARSETDAYIQTVVTTPAADQIAQAKQLLDQGTITQAEFETLQARAMA
jgi:type VI protein secretion system component VasK